MLNIDSIKLTFERILEQHRRRVIIVVSASVIGLIAWNTFLAPTDKVTAKQILKSKVEKISLTGDKFDQLGVIALSADVKNLTKSIKDLQVQNKQAVDKGKREKDALAEKVSKLSEELKKQAEAAKEKERIQQELISKQKMQMNALETKIEETKTIVVNAPIETNEQAVVVDHQSQVFAEPEWVSIDDDGFATEQTTNPEDEKVSSVFTDTYSSGEDKIFDIVVDDESEQSFELVDEEKNEGSGDIVEVAQDEEEVKESIYLPAGSILSGVLLTGGDFPTAVSFKNDPYPVLLRVKTDAILPNSHTSDIQDCFIVAEGHGNLSNERAMIRANTISCIDSEGGAIESSINAYATGSDGKAGVRGRLVSKEGALIAKAMLSGFISGISDAFKPFGTVSNAATELVDLDAKEVGKAGVMSGASNSMERLSNHYIQMADQIFPIIEVDAGRQVEFILKKGTALEFVQ